MKLVIDGPTLDNLLKTNRNEFNRNIPDGSERAQTKRLSSFLKFQFDPGGFEIDFPVPSQAPMLIGIFFRQLGF